MSSIFRLYDVRGVYPRQINEDIIYRVGLCARKLFSSRRPIIVGRDGRNSSPQLYTALLQGLSCASVPFFDVGLMTKPMMVFLIHHYHCAGGIMITASHNPKEYNGIKIADKKGHDISGMHVERLLAGQGKSVGSLSAVFPIKQSSHRYYQAYVAFLLKKLDLYAPIKVVADASNGATAPLLRLIAKKASRLSLVVINDIVDGNFPAHGPNPLAPEALKNLCVRVRKENADFGVAFDGDGDRAVFVDNTGTVVPSEYIWRLFICDGGNHACVHTVASAYAVKQLTSSIDEEKTKLYESHVGRLGVEKTLQRYRADLGFENTGHYYSSDFFSTDSGLWALIKCASRISCLPYTLSTFRSLLPFVGFMCEDEASFDRKNFFILKEAIRKHFASRVVSFSYADGIAAWFSCGWFLVRTSNTQDSVRFYVAAKTAKDARSIFSSVKKIIQADI